MSADLVECLRVEADVDVGVTSRVLDMLSAVDRFPSHMSLNRDDRTEMLSLELKVAAGTSNLAARIGQIPGVRCVNPLVWRTP